MSGARGITRRAVLGAGGAAVLAAGAAVRAAEDGLAAFARGGRVLLMRHALAPGVGDPPGFRLEDCGTQRNLSEAGRAQARRLGERLRAAGVARARVLTSRWCRARDTAALLGLGTPEPFEPLDSFFAEPGRRASSTDRLGAFLAGLPRDGGPIVLVTHQVNITALTGRVPESGEALVLRLDGTASPPVEARVTTEF
ncbi:histidine phosphatase family protein [Prosthecomicrobium sp. N25]|uniref:histidine phosphatase family protein n=1 Tax=Prosthecomicrobium sp. N25 TaxID=3129254 RepID=UPI003077CED4